MTNLQYNSLAAVAAFMIALTSLSAITNVPVQTGVAIAAPLLA